MSTIADRILLVRGKTKQYEFARILNINANTLRNYENGRVNPNQAILERICVHFSVSPEWLVLGTGPMYQGKPLPPAPKHYSSTPGKESMLAEINARTTLPALAEDLASRCAGTNRAFDASSAMQENLDGNSDAELKIIELEARLAALEREKAMMQEIIDLHKENVRLLLQRQEETEEAPYRKASSPTYKDNVK